MQRVLVCVAMLSLAACQQQKSNKPAGAATNPTTEEQKAFYALGLTLGRNISVFDMTPEELEYVKAGLEAQLKGDKPAVDLQEFGPKLGELARKRSEARAAKEKEKGKPFLDTAAKEQGAERLESGMVYRSLQEGSGATPTATDMVKVHYKGTLLDGKEFDSSYARNEPAQFPLNGVIPCWTQGVQKMKVGGKAKLVCPPDLAYGDRGTPNIPGGSTLVFEVELLEIMKQETPPAPPMPGQAAEQK
jgi:FKBP-type peptidyl-prolyl cis-trans isomerase FkpA